VDVRVGAAGIAATVDQKPVHAPFVLSMSNDEQGASSRGSFGRAQETRCMGKEVRRGSGKAVQFARWGRRSDVGR
jgi:hypothetical protein